MASNDKPSTSRDLKSDSSDEGEGRLENLSIEQISKKLETYRNLCLEDRRGTMFTANEKLRRKPNKYETTFNPDQIDHNISSFNINELLSTGRPSSLLTSMYSDEFFEGSICPVFKGFVAERDKVDYSNDNKLNGIEYRFDFNDHQFQNNSEESVRDDNIPDNNEPDNN
ncbi:hypothetical protein QTP88_000444 [Uroleucon formosanum]